MMRATQEVGDTPSPALLRWVSAPQQARTRAGLARLLDAAEALVSEHGFDGTSIAAIAEHAGSSIGAFYRRFRDKDRLLHALHERFCVEARATADAALDPRRWNGAPTSAVLPEFVAFLVRIFREREGFLRAIIVRGATDSVVRRRTERLFDHITERFATLLRERQRDLTHPDPTLAATVGLRVLLGTLDHTVMARPSTSALSDSELANELSRVLLAYLGAAVTPPTLRKSPTSRRTR